MTEGPRPGADRVERLDPAPGREPVILPFAPRRGWAAADGPRRVFAVACLLTIAAVPASTLVPRGSWDPSGPATAFTVVVVLAGPPMCYSLARVLRPHPQGVGWERRWRHWAAAIATAYGSSMLGVMAASSVPGGSRWWLFDPDGGAFLFLLVQASAAVIGPVTVVWGLAAVLWRAVDRRWPGHLSTPGFVTIDDDAEAEDASIAAHRDRTRAP
jgi:hypothetical protein